MDNDLKELLELLKVLEAAEAVDRYEAEAKVSTGSQEQTPFDRVDRVDPRSTMPAQNIRKTYIQQGGLGGRTPIDGYYSPHELRKYQCVHCKKLYTWSSDLEYTDFGDVIDNLCAECRKELRAMRTNHPEMQ